MTNQIQKAIKHIEFVGVSSELFLKEATDEQKELFAKVAIYAKDRSIALEMHGEICEEVGSKNKVYYRLFALHIDADGISRLPVLLNTVQKPYYHEMAINAINGTLGYDRCIYGRQYAKNSLVKHGDYYEYNTNDWYSCYCALEEFRFMVISDGWSSTSKSYEFIYTPYDGSKFSMVAYGGVVYEFLAGKWKASPEVAIVAAHNLGILNINALKAGYGENWKDALTCIVQSIKQRN